ncbi:Clp protease ClpP [Puniceicoccaceae bacterium K14]|nr:Clp protease ClpP [Puniceicoccaceae bacterium K14]
MKKSWYKIKNAKSDKADVYIYGEIGWEVTANSFAKDFAEITASSVDIHINSQGGFVNDGVAIYTLLRGSGKTINTIIDGNALSIAAYIAMAGSTVSMAQDGFFLVHKASGGTYGNSDELQETIEFLEMVDTNLANRFAEKTGKTAEEMYNLMKEDRFLTADEAKELGFVDTILDALEVAAYSPAVNKFRKPAVANSTPVTEIEKEKTKENKMDIKDLLVSRGVVKNSASDADVITQLTEFIQNAVTNEAKAVKADELMKEADEEIKNLKAERDEAEEALLTQKVSNAVETKVINEDQKEFYTRLLKADPEAAEAFANKRTEPVAPTKGTDAVNNSKGGKQPSEMSYQERLDNKRAQGK